MAVLSVCHHAKETKIYNLAETTFHLPVVKDYGTFLFMIVLHKNFFLDVKFRFISVNSLMH